MAYSTFRGGIHPHKRKSFTREKPVEVYLPKKDLVYPLSQHVGGAAVPVVEPGERVLEGQLIAEASGDISARLHASVSGTIKAIEPRMTLGGSMVRSIVLENDNRYERAPLPFPVPWRDLEPGERIRRIRDAGIVGMGGSGFPTHIKLFVKNPKRIRHVIVNGCECEPYVTADYRRMVENPEWLVEGLRMVLSLFERASGVFAIEDSKRDAITALQLACGKEKRMDVKVLETKYPQGSDRMLVYACTGRRLHSSMQPSDAGCLVLNVETVCDIYRALAFGKPVTERIVTVTGKALAHPWNFLVRIGTSFEELVEAAGGFSKEPKKFVAGGPLMGTEITNLDVPVVKTSSALLCMTKDPASTYTQSACIRCGSCVEVCPERLLPMKLMDLAMQEQEEEFFKLNGMECMECGSCSYVCPARRNLTGTIRGMRRSMLVKGLQ